MSSVLPSYSALSEVGQGDLFEAVLPSYSALSAVVQKPKNGCPTPKETAGRTAKAQASTPFALARSGGTPTPSARSVAKKPKAKPKGRVAGGPACLGCVHYQAVTNAAGTLRGEGDCLALERRVAANDRRPCGLYEFGA